MNRVVSLGASAQAVVEAAVPSSKQETDVQIVRQYTETLDKESWKLNEELKNWLTTNITQSFKYVQKTQDVISLRTAPVMSESQQSLFYPGVYSFHFIVLFTSSSSLSPPISIQIWPILHSIEQHLEGMNGILCFSNCCYSPVLIILTDTDL